MNRRSVLTAAASAAVAVLLPLSAQAQAWPNKPVTLVVPFPPGGGTDAFARPLAAQLTRQIGRQVIIDNRGGAGGTVGASFAAKAGPDGYTFFIGAVHHAIAPSFYPKLDYDIERDLIPMTTIANPPQVIVVSPSRVKAANFGEFLGFVRANPGKLNFGSAGNGTSHHLAGELFKQMSKSFIVHIPYRGAGPALQDLIAGNVDMIFDGLGSSATHIRSGRIKALAVAAPKRVPAFPDVPTAAEAGLPGYEVSTWYGIWAVKGTPTEVVDRMYDEVFKAINTPELREIWASNGSEIALMKQADFARFLNSEIKRWAQVTKASGARLD
jgi:tripartite-type tricarboxylate transporter receptor subunit TctC